MSDQKTTGKLCSNYAAQAPFVIKPGYQQHHTKGEELLCSLVSNTWLKTDVVIVHFRDQQL